MFKFRAGGGVASRLAGEMRHRRLLLKGPAHVRGGDESRRGRPPRAAAAFVRNRQAGAPPRLPRVTFAASTSPSEGPVSSMSRTMAFSRQRRLVLLVAVLTLGFGLTAALAWQAQAAAHTHRWVAERTLKEYASFGALQFAVHAKEALYAKANGFVTRPVDPAVGITGHEAARQAAERVCYASPKKGKAPRYFFSLDLRSGEMAKAKGCIGDATRGWLGDTVARHATAKFDRRWDYAEFVAPAPTEGGQRWIVRYSVRFDDAERAVSAFGFATPYDEFTESVYADVMKHYAMLPPALTDSQPNDSLLSVRVTDPSGRVVWQSGRQYASKYAATYASPKLAGNVVHLTLRPEAAEKLVIGGLPRSRLPLLLGLLALAGALTIVALYQLRREDELARLRSDFISGISHELRTPLAQVRMFAETLLLDRVRSDGERRRSLEIIDQEARRLTHLVENVLQFSRNERNVTRLSPEPTDVAAEVLDAVEAFEPIAAARGAALAVQLGDECECEVDRAALRQVLLNFLDNAVKYGPTGQTITVGARCEGRALRVWVDDEGPGIPERDRARIWAPFQRLDRDANSAVAGSGIGLSVVRDLVVMHGGRAWVEAAPSGGSRFVIELPKAGRAGDDAAPAAAVQAPTTIGAGNGRGPRPRAGV